MCGACGGPPPDPAGTLVAGPRRRTAVARLVGARCPALTVRAVPGGWTVGTRTGATTVCRTLAALLAAALPAGEHAAALAAVTAGAGEGRSARLDA